MNARPGEIGDQAPTRVELADYARVLWRYKTLILAGPVIAAILGYVIASMQSPIFQAAATIVGQTTANAAIPAPAVTNLRALAQSAPIIQAAVAGAPAARSIEPARFVGDNLTIEHLRDTNMMTVSVRLRDAAQAAEVANRIVALTIDAYARSQEPTADPEFVRLAEQHRDEHRRAVEALALFKAEQNLQLAPPSEALLRQPMAVDEVMAELSHERELDAQYNARRQLLEQLTQLYAAKLQQLDAIARRVNSLTTQLAARDEVAKRLDQDKAALDARQRELGQLAATAPSRDRAQLLTKIADLEARVAGASAYVSTNQTTRAAIDGAMAEAAAARLELARLKGDYDQAVAAMNEANIRRGRIATLEMRAKLLSARSATDAERPPHNPNEEARLLEDVKGTADLVAADDARIAGTSARLGLVIGQQATAPAAPIAPVPKRSAILSAALGLLGCIVAAFIADYIRLTARTTAA